MKKMLLVIFAVFAVALGACKSTPSAEEDARGGAEAAPSKSAAGADNQADEPAKPKGTEALPAEPDDPSLEVATFAGGCFWCMEPPFEKLDGVEAVISGYTGGDEPHPTYEEVSSGTTGHAESVQIYYHPDKISYDKLLDVFWHNINPTQENGQFVDHGTQYRSAIFYHGPEQKELAEQSKKALAESGRFDKPIVTEIVPAKTFWKAEEYHQDFYKKSPARYHSYRRGSGRDQYIERVWGDEH